MITAILRGLRGLCPACGSGSLFRAWNQVNDRCPACDFELGNLQENTWAFMYLSTAGLTGTIVVGMFLLTPSDVRIARFVVLLVAFGVIAGSLPYRKGIALAIEYLIDKRWGEEVKSSDDSPPRGNAKP